MNDPKRNNAGRIFDAIGQIDDGFIYEAMSYRPAKKRISLRFARTAFVCVALAVLTVIFTARAMLRNVADDTDFGAVLTLADVLSEASGSYCADKGDIDLFDDRVKFIYTDGNGYKTVYVNANAGSLLTSFSIGDETSDSFESGIRIWLSLGDGRVVSPYLKLSEGNVWYNELFDYVPEGEPSSGFSEFVKRVTSA